MAEKKKKRTYLSQSDVPGRTLEEAMRIPRAIFDNYAGDPTTPLRVASAIEMQPTSGPFKQLCGASIAYGLTDGGYNASQIEVMELAKRLFKPLKEGDDHRAKVEAFLKPRVINEFMNKYNGHPLPKENIAYNVLEEMGVPADKTEQVFELITSSAKNLGLTTEIKDRVYIEINHNSVESENNTTEEDSSLNYDVESSNITEISGNESIENEVDKTISETQGQLKRVFITHGKNKKFIEPIKKLLAFGELEPVVSTEKQSVSQPVPDKVMNEMRSCGAAIIHVSDELKLMDAETNEHVVLNPNVLIEIGAAMALFGKRFILLVKEGVTLPSNLQGLYEVRYKDESLDGDTTIKLLEAINEMKKVKPGI